jgi:hypothetical protein
MALNLDVVVGLQISMYLLLTEQELLTKKGLTHCPDLLRSYKKGRFFAIPLLGI